MINIKIYCDDKYNSLKNYCSEMKDNNYTKLNRLIKTEKKYTS